MTRPIFRFDGRVSGSVKPKDRPGTAPRRQKTTKDRLRKTALLTPTPDVTDWVRERFPNHRILRAKDWGVSLPPIRISPTYAAGSSSLTIGSSFNDHQMKVEFETGWYPLSPMQRGMLFHSLSARVPGVDIEQILCGLHEELDSRALERAWQRVAERHDVLRTGFQWEALTEPRQEVRDTVEMSVQEHDWRDVPKAERENRFADWLLADRQRGFDLSQAPVMRLTLFRFEERDYRLVWTFHHLLLDGRAVVVVLKEVFAFYESFQRGEESMLSAPQPYRHYINWLQQKDFSQAKGFWQETLKGFTAPTPLPGRAWERGREAARQRDDIRGEQELMLSEAATARLERKCENGGDPRQISRPPAAEEGVRQSGDVDARRVAAGDTGLDRLRKRRHPL